MLFLLAVAGGYFFTYKQWNDLSKNRTELSTVQEQNKTLTESQSQMKNFLSRYHSLSEEQLTADKIIPVKEADIHNFLQNLSKYSQDSAVFVTGTSFTESKVKPLPNAVTYVDMKITANGTYPSLRNFIDLLETNLRLVDINTINASVQSTQDPTKQTDSLDYVINARIYYQN